MRMKAFLSIAAIAAAVAAAADSEPPREEASWADAVNLDATITADVTSGYLLYGALMNSQPCAQGGAEAGASTAAFGRLGVGA